MSKITRVKRDTPFVQIDKRPLQDKTISWKSKGLLSYLLSLPDDWQIYVNELKNHSKDGRDSTRTAMNELIKAGYVWRDFSKRSGGKFTGYDYFVSETPLMEKPKTENPITVNRTILISKETNNNNTNIELKEKNFKKGNSINKKTDLLKTKAPPEKEKIAQKRKRFTLADIDWPPVFDQNKKLKDTFLSFAQMRQELKKPYKTKKGTETKLRALANDCEKYGIENVIGAIEFSEGSEYLGIFVHDYTTKKQRNEKQRINNEPKQEFYEAYRSAIYNDQPEETNHTIDINWHEPHDTGRLGESPF